MFNVFPLPSTQAVQPQSDVLSEVETTPSFRPYARLDAGVGSFVGAAAPAKEPANDVLAAAAYTAQGGMLNPVATELLGVPARSHQHLNILENVRFATRASGIGAGAGEAVDIVVLFRPATGPAGRNDYARLTVTNSLGTDLLRMNYGGANVGKITIHSWNDLTSIDTGSWATDTANNRVVDLGGGIYLGQVRLISSTDMSGDVLHVGANRYADNSDLTIAGLYVGPAGGYRHDAPGDAGLVRVPGYAAPAELVLMANKLQRASLDGAAATLVLPPPPVPDTVAEYVLRARIANAGQLSLPSAGVRIFGDGGPFRASALVAIRHYDDGSADIVARGT